MTSITGWIRGHPFPVLLGFLMAGSAALLLTFRSQLNFMLDDWSFVIYRADGGFDDYLMPHNEHVSIIPVAIYKFFLEAFGMGSPLPLQLVSVFIFLICVFVLFLYLRPLTGEPLAVIGCAIVLFLGTGWEDLLWTFQLGFSISIAAGLGALVMLRREDRVGDRMAGLLLTISMLSTSMGLPFLAGAIVEILLRRGPSLRRLWLVAVPAALYAIWWLGWGHEAQNGMSFANLLDSPRYVLGALTLAIADVNGSFALDGNLRLAVAGTVTVMVVAGAGFYLWRERRLPRPLLVGIAVALAFWGLAALNQIPGRGFEASRYQLPGVIFLFMVLAGALDGIRIRPRYLVAIGAIALVGITLNLFDLRMGYRDGFKPISDKGIASLTALDIARNTVADGYAVGINHDDSATIDSTGFFAAEERWGDSPAWNASEILAASPAARSRIDQILIGALPVTSRKVRVGSGPGSCRSIAASPTAAETARVTGTTFTVKPTQDAFVAMGRFGDETTHGVTFVEGGSSAAIKVPRDRSDVPWRVGFLGEGQVQLCPGKP